MNPAKSMVLPPRPHPLPRLQQHRVADLDYCRGLVDAIPANPDLLEGLRGRHILSMRHFSDEMLLQLFRLAATFELGQVPCPPPLAGHVLAMAFLDPHKSPTKLSFFNAWSKLGGIVMEMGDILSGVEYELEAMAEFTEMCNSYSDAVVVRTDETESLQAMEEIAQIPIINAGNGLGENPTHAMADLYTLFKWRPDLIDPQAGSAAGPPLQIAFAGWPARSRAIRSLLLGLAKFPHAIDRVVVVGRNSPVFADGQQRELEQAGLTILTDADLHPHDQMLDCLKKVLPSIDFLFVDPSHLELSRQGAIEGMAALKQDALVLHPNLLQEKYREFFYDTPHNAYPAQVRGATFLRMALLAKVCPLEQVTPPAT